MHNFLHQYKPYVGGGRQSHILAVSPLEESLGLVMVSSTELGLHQIQHRPHPVVPFPCGVTGQGFWLFHPCDGKLVA